MFFSNRNELNKHIQAILPETINLRHRLHRHPEIRFEEHWTSDCIAERLTQSGIDVTQGYCGGTGLLGEVGPDTSRSIALRADMDGLEIQEQTGVSYASEIPKRMHACGHDGHIAMLCAAAHIVAHHKNALGCKVRFIFQPGEEMGAGGKRMVDAGVLDGVSAVFGMHGWPDLPTGQIGLKPGYAMAGADWFRVTIHGRGCHGAAPNTGIDPIVTAAHVILGLQSIVSREVTPCEPAVVSVGQIHAGSTTNSIPETATLSGTFRTLSSETQETVRAAIKRIAHGTAALYRATASVEFDSNAYVPLYNDPESCAFAKQAIQTSLGEAAFVKVESPSMAAEDFAFFLKEKPGAFLWLGTGDSSSPSPPLHSPYFDFNDDALATGIQVWLALVTAFMNSK